MLAKQRRLHQSSRVKLPLVNKSASWFLVSKYFDLDLGVQFDSVQEPILRDSMGSRHTCLIVGLRPLIIILITASWSSKCTTGLCTEKNVRSWSHDLDLTTDDRFGHLLSSTWCYGFCACSFPRLLLVCTCV